MDNWDTKEKNRTANYKERLEEYLKGITELSSTVFSVYKNASDLVEFTRSNLQTFYNIQTSCEQMMLDVEKLKKDISDKLRALK